MAHLEKDSIVVYFSIEDFKPFYQDLFRKSLSLLRSADIIKALDDDSYKLYQFATVCIFINDQERTTFKTKH